MLKIFIIFFLQAALWDNAELLEDLLRGDQLSHINSQDSWGRTPLHAAATTENSRCLRVLLQAGGTYICYLFFSFIEGPDFTVLDIFSVI